MTSPTVHLGNSVREQPSARDGESEMDEYESLNPTQWECLVEGAFIESVRDIGVEPTGH